MAPLTPFTAPLWTMTPAVSRQVLGPRVPTSLRVIKKPAPAVQPTVTPATVTAEQTRALTFGKKGGDLGEDKTHVTDKPASSSKLDIHSSASATGHSDRGTSHTSSETVTGHARSQAAMQKDERKAGEKTKKDHPEAPEPIIGMADERGGRGH